MGRTVEELSATMSMDEFHEWAAFHDVEPFGTPVEDDRFRNVLALQYKALNGRAEIHWLDRDPEWSAHLRDLARPPLDDAIEAYFEARIAAQRLCQNADVTVDGRVSI